MAEQQPDTLPAVPFVPGIRSVTVLSRVTGKGHFTAPAGWLGAYEPGSLPEYGPPDLLRCYRSWWLITRIRELMRHHLAVFGGSESWRPTETPPPREEQPP